MKTAVRKHRLTFRQVDLENIRSGKKTCTVRFSKAAAAARPGEALVLQVGSYSKPVVLESVIVKTERISLEPELHRAFDLPPDVLSLTAEREFYAKPLEPDEATTPALLEALRDSGGDLEAVLMDAAERGVNTCTAVWWTLA